MNGYYVIQITAGRDYDPDKRRQTYVGIDDGRMGTGYPTGCCSRHTCKTFETIDDAKAYFEKEKQWVLNGMIEPSIDIVKVSYEIVENVTYCRRGNENCIKS